MDSSVEEKEDAGVTVETEGLVFSSKECSQESGQGDGDDSKDDSSSSSWGSSKDQQEHELHEGVGSSTSGGETNEWEVMEFESDEDSDRHQTAAAKEMIKDQEDDEEEMMPPLVEKAECIDNKVFDNSLDHLQQQQRRKGEVYKMPSVKEESDEGSILLWPIGFIISTIMFQMRLVGYSFSLAMFLLHISYSIVTEPIHRTVQAKNKVTGKISHGMSSLSHAHTALWDAIYEIGPKINRLVSRVGYGILAAAYISVLMTSLVVPAILIDAIFVSRLVEEPVKSRENLHFDYTEPRPSALVPLFPHSVINKPCFDNKWIRALPKSHRFHITVALRLPESDHNIELGMFQVTAEIMSVEGIVLARFTQPCMLRYRSRPIRYARTLVVAVPLVLGIETETQTLVLSLVEAYEDQGSSQAASVRIMLEPRAGFQPGAGLPELYDAKIVLQSSLPIFKSLIYKWKWTFYVWSGIGLYLLEIGLMLCCCKHALLLTPRSYNGGRGRPLPVASAKPIAAPVAAPENGSRGRALQRKKVSFQDDVLRDRAAAAGVGTRPSDIENFLQREMEALSGTKEKLSSVQELSSSSSSGDSN